MERWLVVLLGPPGSGKGTHGRRWATEHGCLYVATGDLLRDAIRRGTPLGQQAHSYVARGDLVPDPVMAGLIEEVLQTAEQCVVLDGYPRTVAQAVTLDDLMGRWGWRLKAAVLLEVGEDEVVERLSARRVCPQCGAVYNLLSVPPRHGEVCDGCGTLLVQRDDDRPEVVRRRLEVYRQQTQPVAAYYAQKGVLVTVNASGTPDEVYARLCQVMGE